MNLFSTKSEFTKNTLILVAGTVVAQSIPLLSHPFLRRVYTPEDFGAYAVYMNIFGILSIIFSMRYEATIVLPKNDHIAANILGLTFILNFLFCLLLFLLILLFKSSIVSFINLPRRYANYLFFLPFACCAFAMYQSLNFWLIRQKEFKASTSNKIVRRTVEGFFQSGLGFLNFPGGLFIGDLFGNFANVIAGIKQVFKSKFSNKNLSLKKMTFVFKKYIDYPKYNAVPTLLSCAASMLPFIFINKLYSTTLVGYLDLSKLVLSIPLIFISTTISQVLFQQITEKKNNLQSIKSDIKNVMFLLLGIILIEVIAIFTVGPFLFAYIFGEFYKISGEYAQILIFSFVFNFISSTFSSIYFTFDKIKLNSIWQIFYFLSICCLMFLKDLSITSFLKIYVSIEIIMHLINCSLMFVIVKNYELKIR